MRGCSLWITVSLLTLAVFAAPAIAQDGGDAVRKTDGKWLIDQYGDGDPTREEMEAGKIVVIKEEYDYLHYRFRAVAGNQRLPQGEVKYVMYYQRDAAYDRAVGLMNNRDYEGALEAFQDAVNSRASWVPQYALWNIVLLHEGLGQPQKALGAIDALTKRFSRTKYLIDARIKAGKLRLALGDVAGARREFGKIRSIPRIDPGISAEVDYWLIYIEEQAARTKSDLERVKGKYESLMGKIRGKYKNVETKCRLGMGRCLVALEQYQEALAFFQKITKESEEDEVLAGAYLMIGEAYFAMQKWEDARRAYLRVCVLWDAFPELHSQALCRAGNCFLLTRDTDYKNRARQEFSECINRYPGSHWAKEASDLRGTIR